MKPEAIVLYETFAFDPVDTFTIADISLKRVVGQSCPTHGKSMTYTLVAGALPPLMGSAYGRTSTGKGVFQRPRSKRLTFEKG